MSARQKSTDVFSFVATLGSTFRGRIVEGAEPERIQVSHCLRPEITIEQAHERRGWYRRPGRP